MKSWVTRTGKMSILTDNLGCKSISIQGCSGDQLAATCRIPDLGFEVSGKRWGYRESLGRPRVHNSFSDTGQGCLETPVKRMRIDLIATTISNNVLGTVFNAVHGSHMTISCYHSTTSHIMFSEHLLLTARRSMQGRGHVFIIMSQNCIFMVQKT